MAIQYQAQATQFVWQRYMQYDEFAPGILAQAGKVLMGNYREARRTQAWR